MQPWKTKVICAGKYRPRQFEYHPLHEDVVVFGTLRGEAVVADVASNSVCSSISSGLSRDKRDSILGLCWLKQSPSRFVVGSSHGFLRLCDAGAMPSVGARAETAAERFELEDRDLTSRSNAVQEAVPFNGKQGAAPIRPVLGGNGEGGMDDRFSEAGRILTEFENFEKLTSVHINSTDDQLLASGYTFGVKLFDLGTGQVVRAFDDIHEDHINISRFANHSPFVFATSSFDKTVKAWDSRVRADKAPIYTCHSEMGHVMLSFSPDDVFLLTSAVDNEVKQYLALDGRLHMDLEIPKTRMDENFTRSYYTSSGRLILSGSSEEQTVRLYCAQTGRLIHCAEMYPGRKHGSLYVQSLRGDPHHDFQFSVLVNYRDTAYPLEIVNVDMLQGTDGEDLSSLTAYASSSRLSADLGRACVDKEGADVYVVARDRSRFLAHKAIISCRSEVLGGFLADAAASEGKPDAADAAKLRLGETSDEGNRSEATLPSPEANGEENTAMVSVCLPPAVAPDIVPVILAFLYTDRLEFAPENGPDGVAKEYVDPGVGGKSRRAGASETSRQRGSSFGGDSKEAGSSNGSGGERESGRERGEGMSSTVAFYEKVLEAAGSLGLERLTSLVEWECRQLVNTTTVLSVASVALRQGTEQLLKYCVHYLGTHLQPVLELYGRESVPPIVQARMDEERRHRVYALNSESKGSSVPDMMMVTPPARLPPSGQANGDAAAAGTANEDAAGGSALGAALAAATAAVNAALRNAPAAQQGLGQGGAAAVEDANQVAPANGGDGEAVGGTEGNENVAHPAPDALDPMEDLLIDEVGFMDDAYEEEDEDDFIDEEVDVEGDSSSDVGSISDEEDEDEGGWMEPSHGGNLPAVVRRRLVPTVTGHTASAVLGSQMMVLGGGNKRQFHSCRHVLVYDPIERTWSKLATRGNAPAALIYHSCTALEPPWSCPRNLLVFGGNSTARNLNVSVLDSLTMEWRQPKIEGDPIGVRTRHTAVAVHADYEEHERAHVHVGDESLVGQFQELTAEDMLETAKRSPEEKGCGKRRDFPRSPVEFSNPRDFGGDTDVIIFGGFSPIAGHAFNDVVVLNVRRSGGGVYSTSVFQGDSVSNTSSGNGNGRGGEMGAFSSSSGRVHPARRRRHSKGVHPVWDSDEMDDVDSDGGSEQREKTATRGSPHGYTYRWLRPIVRGTPPVGRLAHSSAVVRLPEGEGGSGASGHQAYMVVFGGVGTGQLFNDVSVLKCTNTRTMTWERVFVRGRRPAMRYGHSMVPLSAPSGACGYAKLVLFGGTSGHNAFNDLFILNISWGKVEGRYGILAKWESLATQMDGVRPCPRSRQTMCQLNGELIVFGGSDETPETHNTQPASKEVDAFVYHVRPRLRRKLLGPSQRGGVGGAGRSSGRDSGGGGGGNSCSNSPLEPSLTQTGAVRDNLALLRWHERAMAKEVIANMGLVEAAQERRAEAANTGEGKATVGDICSGAAAAPQFAATRIASMAAGRQSEGGSAPSTWEHRQESARLVSTGSGTTAYWDAIPVTNSLLQPERIGTSHERGNKAPIRSYGIKVVWECIRPDAFVFEPGPEPPVVVKPMTLHKDIQTLIDNERFADVKFRFQAVDFALPTTPTNTAHYAIVPPPTPTLSPKSGLSSPISGAMAMGPDPSSRPPHMRSPKFGPASGGGGGGALGSKVAASKLPQDSSDTAADGSAGETSAEVWPRRNSGRAQSVVMRSSAGQEWENSRCVSPGGGWSIINRPSSYSPLGSGHRSSAGGRRRFFGLSETAEAEAEAAALLANRSEAAGRKGAATACGEGTPTVGGKSDGRAPKHCIEAHRFLLSLRSDPMRAMLRSGMKETFASVCLLKDIRPPVFSALLTYVYTDTLQLQRPEDITELLVVSNQYNLTDLLSLCEGFLQGVLDEENASHLYHYADSLAMPTFEHRCLTFILRNWRKVIRTEGWAYLPQELKVRANAFRTTGTHLFMLGQKDHMIWKGGERDMMADWVFDRASSDTYRVEEIIIQETITKGKEEGWQTASDGGGDSDAAFFSADSRSPTTTHSPPSSSPNSTVEPML